MTAPVGADLVVTELQTVWVDATAAYADRQSCCRCRIPPLEPEVGANFDPGGKFRKRFLDAHVSGRFAPPAER